MGNFLDWRDELLLNCIEERLTPASDLWKHFSLIHASCPGVLLQLLRRSKVRRISYVIRRIHPATIQL